MTASCLYAENRALASYVLVYAEPLLSLALMLLLPGPLGLGLDGVWLAIPLAQLLTSLLSAITSVRERNKG